jgi:hypothetical protein
MALRHEDPRYAVSPLAPRLFRKLAVVTRKDKVLHRGLREVAAALRSVSTES